MISLRLPYLFDRRFSSRHDVPQCRSSGYMIKEHFLDRSYSCYNILILFYITGKRCLFLWPPGEENTQYSFQKP